MGKSGRARKAKRADFQKIKIKVGKKLKKAQNESTTDFKARKIILKEQLATKSTETLVTKKQHDVKELLSRLNYHNVYVRQDGVNGLRELVSRYDPGTLLPHLSTFITRGAPCILDSDSLIRSSATKFLETLIIKMGHGIEPYFHLLATHLSCAMVHLNVGVQSDSLELMKILIKHTPNLVARHANTIITNFINLIARKVVTGRTTSVQKEVVKPMVKFSFANFHQPSIKNQLAGHSGRLSLLNELSNFLEAVLAERGRVEKEVPLTTWDTVAVGSSPPIMWCNTENKAEELWLFTDAQRLKEFTDTVIKLLVELWLEVDSESEVDSSVGGNALNEEGVEILSCVVSITMHIWHITQICTQEHPKKCSWLRKHFASDFLKRIMGGFPFCCHVSPHRGKKRKKNKEVDQILPQEQVKQKLKHCDDLNILLARFGTQMSFVTHQEKVSHREKSINYLSQLLRDGNRDGQYSISTAVRIIKELLPLSPKSEIQTIVISAYTCFKRFHPFKKDRALLVELLLEATDHNHEYMLSNPSVDAWVKDIVKDLASGHVREPLLNAAIQLRLRNNTEIKQLLINDRDRIQEAIKTNGIQGLSVEEIDKKLHFLLKD